MTITRINPDTLYKSPVFTQVAAVTRPAKLIFVGGQNGVAVEGRMAGSDIVSQSEQAYKNLIVALEAAGASLQDVVKMTIYIVQGHSIQDAFGAVQRVQVQQVPPPTVSVIVVAGLANPNFLIEIEAIAAVEQ
jgi:enamine deaminase RidA (YjgF/YER057c/UK114 family)